MGWNINDHLNANYKDDERVGYGLNGKTITVKELRSMDREIDEYMTLSTLQPYATHRCQKMVRTLKFLHADLDLWHDDGGAFSEMHRGEVFFMIENEIFVKGLLPWPTYVFYTGRGFLFLWRIFGNRDYTSEVHIKAKASWMRCQKYIHYTLKKYCADKTCVTDTARIFRVVGSVNGHNGETVEMYEMDDDRLYNLYDFEQKWVVTPKIEIKKKPLDSNAIQPPTEKQIKLARILAEANNLDLPAGYEHDWRTCKDFIRDNRKEIDEYATNGKYVCKNAGLYLTCMRILEKYVEDNPQCIGKRERILWVYRICEYALDRDHDVAEDMVRSLNQQFEIPLSDKDKKDRGWLQQTESAERYNDRYMRSLTRYISEITDLSWSESKARYYKRRQLTKEEKSEYDRRRYVNQLASNKKQSKKDEIQERDMMVFQLIKEGKTDKEIMNSLEISKSTLKRTKKKVISNDEIKEGSKFFTLYGNKKSFAFPTGGGEAVRLHIDGGAGTGKSHWIREYIKDKEEVLVVAPTNKAASQIGGQTIHRAFGLTPGVYGPNSAISYKTELRNIQTVVIDEIGMVRFDVFHQVMRILEAIEHTEKHNISIILVGDYRQLPPVITEEDMYQLQYFWSMTKEQIGKGQVEISPMYKKYDFELIEFTEVKRQTRQEDAILCNRIRRKDPEVISELNKKVDPSRKYMNDATHLCSYRSDVAEINSKLIEMNKDKCVCFKREGKFFENKELFLYKGMPVIATRNTKSYKNGDYGTVIKMNKKSVRVNFGETSVLVKKEKYISNGEEYTELPLEPAFALTIHKSQGMTIRGNIVVHGPMFEDSMLYTAITRAADLSRVWLTSPVTMADLGCNN